MSFCVILFIVANLDDFVHIQLVLVLRTDLPAFFPKSITAYHAVAWFPFATGMILS